MTDWPEYESHKVVRAAKIVHVARHQHGEITIMADPGTGTAERFEPNMRQMAEMAARGDWAVIYEDGFKSVSPAKAFEEDYIRKGLKE